MRSSANRFIICWRLVSKPLALLAIIVLLAVLLMLMLMLVMMMGMVTLNSVYFP